MRPSNLIYGVDDKPAPWESLFLGFQHVCIYAISLIIPVIVVREAGGSADQAAYMVTMSMIAGGIGAIVQALSKGPVGSGYLCPPVCGPSFLSASVLAAKTGGLALVFGMTAMAGFLEAAFSRTMHRLRVLFPAEVTGLIVAMVGITVIRVAAMNFFGLDMADATSEPLEVLVSFVTLAAMVGLNVWTKGKLRLFSVLMGMTVGYVASFFLGVLTVAQLSQVAEEPLVSFPIAAHPGWAFSWHLVVPFAVAMVCSSLKSVGDLTTCQKINDAAWKRPDMKNISGGILADSVGCITAGALGGMGQSTSSTNVGLSIATGATSRVIAFAQGGLLVFLGFCPKLAAIFATMPKPVIGATLIFALSFMVMAGFQIIMSRMIDARKTFVVGLSVIFGLTVDIVPEVFANLHPWVQPLFSSSLSTATVSAVVLNLIFRIGIARRVRLEVLPGVDGSEKIFNFMDQQGGLWGARHEVIYNAMSAMNEFVEAAVGYDLAKTSIIMDASFDEYNLDVDIRYQGKLADFPSDRPNKEELRKDPEAAARLAGFLIRQYADKLTAERDGDQCRVRLHFDH